VQGRALLTASGEPAVQLQHSLQHLDLAESFGELLLQALKGLLLVEDGPLKQGAATRW
jgi:hypothetical protein